MKISYLYSGVRLSKLVFQYKSNLQLSAAYHGAEGFAVFHSEIPAKD